MKVTSRAMAVHSIETMENLSDHLVYVGQPYKSSGETDPEKMFYQMLCFLTVKVHQEDNRATPDHRITVAYNEGALVEHVIDAVEMHMRNVEEIDGSKMWLVHADMGAVRNAGEKSPLMMVEICEDGEKMVLTNREPPGRRVQRPQMDLKAFNPKMGETQQEQEAARMAQQAAMLLAQGKVQSLQEKSVEYCDARSQSRFKYDADGDKIEEHEEIRSQGAQKKRTGECPKDKAPRMAEASHR